MFLLNWFKSKSGIQAPSLLLIPDKSSVVGNIQSSHNIRIDGDVKGDLVSTSRVVVSASATVKGDISCKEIMVWGHVEGNILATELIELGQGSHVNGSLTSRKIQTEPGAIIEGTTKITQEELPNPGE